MIRGMQNVSSIFLNDLAAAIGKLEKRNKAAQFILETAAIVLRKRMNSILMR